MTQEVVPLQKTIYQAQAVAIQARITDKNGALRVVADFTSIVATAYDAADAPTGTSTLTVAEVIDDTPATGASNFDWVAPGTFFPNGDTTYKLKVKGTLVTGGYTDLGLWLLTTYAVPGE